MSLAGAVLRRARAYSVTRRTVGTVDGSGLFTPDAAPSTVSIRASMQPTGGKDLQRLPEGLRSEEWRSFWTTTLLYGADATHAPDVIAADGATWQVERVYNWGNLGGFYKVLARRTGTL